MRILTTITALALAIPATLAQGFTNPVLPGFYPDPSVCRVGDTFYMVNSSFQYFPGVPIHQSKDLIHWQQIGHCLTRESQLALPNASFWGGIYAPTIRYHDGLFYMVVTNCSGNGNFFVTASDPASDWSEPIWVDQPGIDPDLFWDNGKTYFMSTTQDCITQCEIDPSTGKKLTESKCIWRGTGGRYPEAPHMYKKDGYFYLLIAEGGTEYAHRATIARSLFVDGPFEANPANPILTQMNRNAEASPIQGAGHADFVQAADSSWWLVCLAFRPQSYNHHLLGRETFLAPVRWDKGAWPVVNGDGSLSLNMDCETLPQVPVDPLPERDDFSSSKLDFHWQYLSNPDFSRYSLSDHKGFVRLKASTVTIDQPASPVFIGRRQDKIEFSAQTSMSYNSLKSGAEAGLSVYMGHEYHYDLYVKNKDGKPYLVLEFNLGLIHHTEKEIPLSSKNIILGVEGSPDAYTFFYKEKENAQKQTLGSANTRFLSSETAGGFTGTFISLYAQSDTENQSYADFDWFEMK